MRSNSLFSALLNEGQKAHQELQFGRWMDRYPNKDSQAAAAVAEEDEAAVLVECMTEPTIEQHPAKEEKHEEVNIYNNSSSNNNNMIINDSINDSNVAVETMESGIGASLERHKKKIEKNESKARAKQQLKEEKQRLRQEKKEAKEREKQRKKEERMQAKLEKKKAIEEEKEREEHIPGSGKPHSINDPLLKNTIDDSGLLNVERPDGWIGAYSPESRKVRIEKFLEKRNHRVWTKTVKYDVRKNFADSRLRVKGRFVKKEDELLMRELMSLT